MRLVLGGILVLFVLGATRQSWFSVLDGFVYDHFIGHLDTPVMDEIVIVIIDSKSLTVLGRWPFPRKLHARLLDIIARGKPAVVGMDINFAEPDKEHPEDDQALVRATRDAGNVVLPVVLEEYGPDGELRESLPFPALRKVAATLGHVHVKLESDGIARSVFLMAGLNRPRWPAFSLAMARIGGDWPASRGFPKSGETPVYRDMSANVWRNHRQVLIPFPADGRGLERVSYVDVIQGRVAPARFQGKYVLLGAAAAGLGDNIRTPVSPNGRPVMGVEFNAWVLNALLQNRLIVPVSPVWQYGGNVLLILLMLMMYRPRGWKWLYGIALLFIGITLGDFLLLSRFGYWYPPAVMLMSILFFFLAANWHLVRKLLKVLFEERRLSQTALTAIGEAVVHLDGRGHIVKFNPVAEKFSGKRAVDVNGRPVDEVFRFFLPGGQAFPLRDQMDGSLRDFSRDLLLKSFDGKEYRVNLVLNKVSRSAGNNQTTVMVLTDMSKEHALASEVSHRKTHNILTGLPNQILMSQYLKTLIDEVGSDSGRLAVIYLDIDHFSKINEARGLEVGNRLLRALAGKLKDFLGEEIKLGHVGGDEFLLVLREFELTRGMDDMVGLIFSLFVRPLPVRGLGEMRISVTLGVSLYPQHGRSPEELIGHASAAMHYGKAEGGNQIVYYEPGMQDKAFRLLEIESCLHRAVERGSLEVFYQPLVEAATGKTIGIEALARLDDESGQAISPEEFIDVAERNGLITEMGYQQLQRACKQLAEWRNRGFILRLSCNFSPRQMNSPGVVDKIRQIVRNTGVDPAWLEFEITENVLLSSTPKVEDVLEQVQALGIGIAIDDFGTGYSSMSYLTRFDFDRLKIDRSFVKELDANKDTRAITSAIITMAHELGMAVVAEGVETREQYERLLALRCDEMQGYYLGRPMSATELEARLVSDAGHGQGR